MADREHAVDIQALTLTLGVASACWVFAVTQMRGMDMGVATGLGSFAFFVGVWFAMMAAMMLPGAAPAVVRYTRGHRHVATTSVFVASYLAVWTLFGTAAYAVYQPHGSVAAAIVTMLAGGYELTPLKRRARRRCQEAVPSGVHFGMYCVGSSIGLMALLLALGAMSIAWMSAVAVLVLMQKVLPPKPIVDVPLALAIVGLGVVILISPSAIPGLVPSM